MMNKFIIWTEGGKKVGMGHVRRCLVIAHQLKKEGADVLFLINDDPTVINQLEEESFLYEIASFGDINCSRVVGKIVDIILIDTKRPIVEIMGRLKDIGYKIVLMDNITPARLKADIAIYPTAIFHKDNIEWNGFNGRVFSGADYVPIAESFIKTRQRAKNLRFQPPYQILITMGGSDPNNLTSKIASSLLNLSMPVKIKAVIGPAFLPHADLSEIEKQRDFNRDFNIDFIRNVKDMSEIMADSHIAITAFGTTIFELAYMGVPSLIIANYTSDEEDMEAFKRLKIGIPLGYYEDVSNSDLKENVEMVLRDRILWEEMSQKGKGLIDGQGAERIVSIMGS